MEFVCFLGYAHVYDPYFDVHQVTASQAIAGTQTVPQNSRCSK
jgi:hypothetical protein